MVARDDGMTKAALWLEDGDDKAPAGFSGTVSQVAKKECEVEVTMEWRDSPAKMRDATNRMDQANSIG